MIEGMPGALGDRCMQRKPGRPVPFGALGNRGFTLVELIVTIVVAGILAAVVLPRWRGDTGFEERQFRDETLAALRLAQKAAIASRRAVCATFEAGQVSFKISTQAPETAVDCSIAADLTLPSGQSYVKPSRSTVTYAAYPASIVFDAAGRNTGAQASITVSGLSDLPITVEAETGYVH